MTDETKMTPEVAEAVAIMDARNGAWNCCRDYLHRVTAENAELREETKAPAVVWRQRAEHAEAELAEALAELVKLRAAPVFTCDAEVISGRDGDYMSMILTHADPAFQYPDLDDKRVRLVVD